MPYHRVMKVAGVFAGIGGFELAFSRAGASSTALVEWDKNCQTLLGNKFPGVPLFSDVRDVKGADLGEPDVLVGGFPCQDISLAGPRTGLAGERSGLFWEFARLLEEAQPRWFILENVAGLLSSGGRRDLGAILGALVDRGYGVVYRVLDAQYFGVPQRRRRIFLVGRLGADPGGFSEVLLEPKSGFWNPQASRAEGQALARAATTSARESGEPIAATPNAISHISPTFRTWYGKDWNDPSNPSGPLILQPAVVRMRSGKPGGGKGALVREDQSLTLAGANDQTLFQPLGFVNQAGATNLGPTEDGSPPITASHGNPGMVAQPDGYEYAVRKLMPVECERLQGFPDGWTEGFSDTVRYRMLGNAVAVPVVEWIARRLIAVDRQEGAAWEQSRGSATIMQTDGLSATQADSLRASDARSA